MNSLTDTIPANPESRCHCCGKVNRKLHLIDGFWLGQNCLEDYEWYSHSPSITNAYWSGWEKRHANVEKMIRSRNRQHA